MLKTFVETLNNVETRVWSLIVIALGLAACVMKQPQAGNMLIGGGLAAFQQKPAQTP